MIFSYIKQHVPWEDKNFQILELTLYLVGTGTSVNPERRTAGASLTNAIIGLSKKSTSPTRTLDASAPEGIFLMKFISTYWQKIIKNKICMVFIRLFRGKQEGRDTFTTRFANQNWWSNECINAKILTSTKNGVDKYRKASKTHLPNNNPNCFLTVIIFAISEIYIIKHTN